MSPTKFDVLKRGVPVSITLQVRTPEGASPGQGFAGFLVVGKQDKKHFRQLLTAPLPVAVLARKNTAEYSHLTVYSEIASPLLMGMNLNAPVDPAPGQGYTASTVTTCANPGDSIGMSVSGTDGYSNSTTCPGVNSCQLFVPGAEEGVVDTVTVTTSNGEPRLIQLVF